MNKKIFSYCLNNIIWNKKIRAIWFPIFSINILFVILATLSKDPWLAFYGFVFITALITIVYDMLSLFKLFITQEEYGIFKLELRSRINKWKSLFSRIFAQKLVTFSYIMTSIIVFICFSLLFDSDNKSIFLKGADYGLFYLFIFDLFVSSIIIFILLFKNKKLSLILPSLLVALTILFPITSAIGSALNILNHSVDNVNISYAAAYYFDDLLPKLKENGDYETFSDREITSDLFVDENNLNTWDEVIKYIKSKETEINEKNDYKFNKWSVIVDEIDTAYNQFYKYLKPSNYFLSKNYSSMFDRFISIYDAIWNINIINSEKNPLETTPLFYKRAILGKLIDWFNVNYLIVGSASLVGVNNPIERFKISILLRQSIFIDPIANVEIDSYNYSSDIKSYKLKSQSDYGYIIIPLLFVLLTGSALIVYKKKW